MFAYSNNIVNDKFEIIGTFSSHWAAVAAIIRTTDPEFKSIGGDKEEDLNEEKRIATR